MQPLRITWESRNGVALLGLLRSIGIVVRPATDRFMEQLRRVVTPPPRNAPARDAAIRAMLRKRGFKPSGRNRPAQEYLGKVAASPMGLSSISNVVDVNNYVSLKYRLPASVIDGSLVAQGLFVREGRPGETYVFNSSGQELRLENLLCLSTRDSVALASPVKDALAAHVTEKTASVVACIYGTRDLLSEDTMAAIVDEYASLLTEHASAKTTDKIVVSALSRAPHQLP